MAASLWVRTLETFGAPSVFKSARRSCPTCKVKLSKSNPFVYSVGEYVRGKRRNIISHVCRNCWDAETRRCVTPADHRAKVRCDQRPHWMDMPLAEPRLTQTERWLLDELCCFDVIPLGYMVVAPVWDGDTGPWRPDNVAYIQTVEVQMDEDEFKTHPLRDWCEEHGVGIDEWWQDYYVGAGECEANYAVSFMLPRRDGQPHESVDPDTGMTETEYKVAVAELHALPADE